MTEACETAWSLGLGMSMSRYAATTAPMPRATRAVSPMRTLRRMRRFPRLGRALLRRDDERRRDRASARERGESDMRAPLHTRDHD